VIYGFHSKRPEDLSAKELQTVREFLIKVEKAWGIRFPEGHDPSLRFMAHVWEPLRIWHKPLVLYGFTEAAGRIAHVLMRLMGFKKNRMGGFDCWTTVAAPCSIPQAETEESEVVDQGCRDEGGREVRYDASATLTETATGKATRFDNDGNHTGHSVGSQPLSPKLMAEVVHSAAEHALDAALVATSIAAAKVAMQYPHDGQQYHLNRTSLELSPTVAGGGTASVAGAGDALADASIPVVFIHGVGFGMLPYLHFVRDLMKSCPGHPFILLEVPQVSLRLSGQACRADDVAAAAVQAVRALGADKALFMGHSYGTFCVSRVCQMFPEVSEKGSQ
jgi:hypothetical protein